MTLEFYRHASGVAEPLPKHSHHEYQFCLSLNVAGEYYYRGAYHAVPPNSLSVLHPGEIHSVRYTEDYHTSATIRLMYASPNLLQRAAVEVGAKATNLPYYFLNCYKC